MALLSPACLGKFIHQIEKCCFLCFRLQPLFKMGSKFSKSQAKNNEESAEALVLQFLEYSKIEFIFKKDGIQEDKKADDLITYSRDMVSRLVLSLTFDRCEKEEDPVGMRGIRRIMIPYFLNRKPVVQDSKVIFDIYILGRINPLQPQEIYSVTFFFIRTSNFI